MDPGLLEKAIPALALLDLLGSSGLQFVFKGGTSLILQLATVRRLSIDIDILCGAAPQELDRILSVIAKQQPFIGYSEDDRGARALPRRRHFRFQYTPITYPPNASHILLDVVEEKRIPHAMETKPITAPFLQIESEVIVQVPTIECLLADKLTAFAPRTIGVPFQPPKDRKPDTMQIVKQLFDVGELFLAAENLDSIRRSYQVAFDLENEYRGGTFQVRDALDDTLDAALRLNLYKLRGVQDHPDALLLADGVKRINSHLVNQRFNLDDARVAATKAALLSRLILSQNINDSLAYWRQMPNQEALQGQSIQGEWERLNRLKAIAPEAFHYWYLAAELQKILG